MSQFPYCRHPTLRPGDVAIALQLFLVPGMWYEQLPLWVRLSLGETHNAIRRLAMAGLVERKSRVTRSEPLLNFLVHGVPRVFPAVLGPPVAGVPTGKWIPYVGTHSTPDRYVWAWTTGAATGISVMPLYPNAPMTANRNRKLYELLALVDAIRIGSPEEGENAASRLRQRILSPERPMWARG